MENRFFYNIDNGKLIDCDNQSHVTYYHNKKLRLKFDDYIRGIIFKNTCFIRVFNPYEDIYNPLEYKALIRQSKELINIYLKDIKKAIKKQYKFKGNVKINISNIDLQGLKLTSI